MKNHAFLKTIYSWANLMGVCSFPPIIIYKWKVLWVCTWEYTMRLWQKKHFFFDWKLQNPLAGLRKLKSSWIIGYANLEGISCGQFTWKNSVLRIYVGRSWELGHKGKCLKCDKKKITLWNTFEIRMQNNGTRDAWLTCRENTIYCAHLE